MDVDGGSRINQLAAEYAIATGRCRHCDAEIMG
jgi:hypothetical protein